MWGEDVSGMSESSLLKRNAMRPRIAIALIVIVTVIGLVLIDGLVLNSVQPAVSSLAKNASSPVAAVGGAQSVEWSCPGGSGSGGPAPTSILITSSRPSAVQAQVRVVSSAGLERFTTVTVPAGGKVSFAASTLLNGPFLGAYVVVNGGGVGVSEIDDGFTGWSVSPCAAHGADQWYFADGSTAGGDRLYMELLNPGATTSVVNLSFGTSESNAGMSAASVGGSSGSGSTGAGTSKATPEQGSGGGSTPGSGGMLSPSAYQGIVIPPFGLVVEDLGHHVVSKVPVATVVSATTGVVVAAELQVGATGGSTVPSDGMALTLGAVSPAKRWWFPIAWNQPGSVDAFHVFNPGNRLVHYKAIFKFSGGSVPPYKMSVPPHTVSTLVAQDIPGLPTAIPYQLEIRVAHGGGIVASSSLAAPSAVAPNPLFGMSAPIGRGYRCWVVPVLPSPATGVSAIGISDLGRKSARVEVRALYSVPGVVPGSSHVTTDSHVTTGSRTAAGHSGITTLHANATPAVAKTDTSTAATGNGSSAYPPNLSLGGSVCNIPIASTAGKRGKQTRQSKQRRSTVAGRTAHAGKVAGHSGVERSHRTLGLHYGYVTIADQTISSSGPFALAGSSMPSLTGATALVISASEPVAVEVDAMPFGTIGAEINPAFSL